MRKDSGGGGDRLRSFWLDSVLYRPRVEEGLDEVSLSRRGLDRLREREGLCEGGGESRRVLLERRRELTFRLEEDEDV